MSVVGFDFGNLNSIVAVARKRGIDVLQNEVGHRQTPSQVAFAGKQRFIGNEAQAQAGSNIKNTLTSVKRLLGRRIDDPELPIEQKFVSYKIVEGPRGKYAAVSVNYDDKQEVFTPEQIAGALFQKLKGVAEGGLDGQKVTDCVIGVPAWWTDAQRRALLDAANIAGLNVLRLLNETTAVALQYGILKPLSKSQELKVLFVDVGHTHTQASLVSFTEGKLTVLATAADRNLGGRDFDDVLVQHFHQYIKEKYKMDVSTEAKAMSKLRKECERVKLHLSANTKVQFNVEYIMNDRDVTGLIDRAEFEALCQKNILSRLLTPVQSVLDQAKVEKSALSSIEVVGGSMRIPAVQKALTEFFGRDLSKTCDADESVARGSALMCAMISPSFKVKEFEVHDASAYAIDLQWGPVPAAGAAFTPDDSTPLFTVNNPLPSVKLISFNDRTEPFQVVARYADSALLPPGTDPIVGRFIVSGMPAKKDGVKAPKIKVRVKLNLHGVLQVTGAQLIEEIEEVEASPSPSPAPAAAAAPMEDVAAAADPAAAAPKSDAMETDEAKAAADAAASPAPSASPAAGEAKKKVKVKKEDLKVESFTTGGLDQATLNQLFEREVAMATQDRVIFETMQARNDLESYVLDMKSRLNGDLAEYVKDADKEAFVIRLTAEEDWLYNDGFDSQKSEYRRRLADLHTVGDAIVQRHEEHHSRDTHVAALKSAIGHYSQFAQSSDEKYAHITPEERKKVSDECTASDQWLCAALSAQDKLSKADVPALTIAQLKQKKTALDQVVSPIMHKPKPAPPKPKEEPKKEEAKPAEPAAEAKPAEAAAADAKPEEAAPAADAKPMEQ